MSIAPVAAEADNNPYRVLIVEDDRSQAMFAEAILRGAGIQAEVVAIPERMMEALERFMPDLVLMDLHMPGTSGTTLTAQIREHTQFSHTPVVFLTGDQDPERELEVLEKGGDDFILKPVRPRHLIAAVQNRIRRARALNGSLQNGAGSDRNSLTGLHTRQALMQALSSQLAQHSPGGALLLELGNPVALRNRYGYAALDALFNSAGQQLGKLLESNAMAARLSDNAFLVVARDVNPAALESIARRLRDGIGYHDFRIGDDPLRLRCTIGYASFAHGFSDAGAVLAATEDATREAHALPAGIAGFVPPETAASDGLINELRAALAPGGTGLYLAFQPVVAVAGGDEAQFQVLARMHGADGSVRKAADFLAAAQAAGLLAQLDRWVMERALALLQQRRAESRPVRLYVSQAPRTLGQDNYASWLQQALERAGVDGPSLVIDIRQEDAVVHTVLLQQFCERLVPAGVQFCLSQFRSTEDGNQLLQMLPLGYLRLSHEFARQPLPQALHDEMRVAIERAHRLGLQVIGQAVEDPQAAAALWVAGIDFIQGNLVQRPEQALDFDFQSAAL
jgi:EAL domain-containing protein (putative c-di-GMP-specific phosphodiesterase class I)/DNA-binding response OmpR family regulator